eukprot:scaffold143727_cov20-Tisochrysis_lutea.AAC.1
MLTALGGHPFFDNHCSDLPCDHLLVTGSVPTCHSAPMLSCSQLLEGLTSLTISAVICHVATCLASALGAPGQSITIITALTALVSGCVGGVPTMCVCLCVCTTVHSTFRSASHRIATSTDFICLYSFSMLTSSDLTISAL